MERKPAGPSASPRAAGSRGLKIFGLRRLDVRRARHLLSEVCGVDQFVELFDVADERLDHPRVESGARPSFEERERFVSRHACAEGAVAAGRVVEIDHGDDARDQRNLLALQPRGVAAAVPPLVVVEHDIFDRVREPHAVEQRGADRRVRLHPLELGGGQLVRLVQDVLGDGELAHVVQQRAVAERRKLTSAEAEESARLDGVDARAADVAARRLVFGVNRRGQRLDRPQTHTGGDFHFMKSAGRVGVVFFEAANVPARHRENRGRGPGRSGRRRPAAIYRARTRRRGRRERDRTRGERVSSKSLWA